MRLHSFAPIVFSALLLGAVGIARADAAPPRTVTTSGEAVVCVVPDEVVVNVGVENFDENLDRAKAANEAQSAKLVKAVKALGVDAKQIQTDTLQVEVEYKENHVWEGVRGYVARRSYVITLKDPKLFESLVDTALRSGGNQVSGFEFRTTELRKYRDQARSMAIKAAREKAVALARDLECGVGKPWQITEGAIGYWGNRGGMNNYQQNAAVAEPAPGDQSETLPLGQIAIRAEVSVVFDLTDK